VSREGWIGVDFDGTLAEYHGWNGGKLGNPIEPMVSRVKKWLKDGQKVKIFTARVSKANRSEEEAIYQEALITAWCLAFIGQELEITCEKDYLMIDLWDDRCHPVELNTGRDLLKGVI